MFDSVFELARSGQGYVAVERTSLILRKLKRSNRHDEAFSQMMALANLLLDSGQPAESGTAANRALRVFPAGHELEQSQRDAVSSFALRLTPGACTPDLSNFFELSVKLLGDKDLQLRAKHAQITDEANSFSPAQAAYARVITAKIEQGQSVEIEFDRLYALLQRWTDTIADNRQRIFTSQFIFARVIFMVLAAGKPATARAYGEAAQLFYERIVRDPKLNSLPLTLLVKLLIRSVVQADPQAFLEVLQAYRPLVAKSLEAGLWIRTIWSAYFATDPQQGQLNFANLATIVNQVLGNLAGNTG